jgi:hypothetical protein
MNRKHDVEKQWHWRRTIGGCSAERSAKFSSTAMIRAGDRFKRSRWISNSRRQFLGALLVHYNLQMKTE